MKPTKSMLLSRPNISDWKPSSPNRFLAAKILSADSTIALQNGFIHELDVLQAMAKRPEGSPRPLLPILHDHFAQRGPHGVHYCILTDALRSDVHTFRASAPTGKLAVHIVKPIIACAVEAVKYLHSHNIIHAGTHHSFLPDLYRLIH
jgi:serine/threonine-protein kinase SRPK3